MKPNTENGWAVEWSDHMEAELELWCGVKGSFLTSTAENKPI